MKKYIMILLMISLLFAQTNRVTVRDSLNNLQEQTRSFLAVTIIFELIGAAIFLSIAFLIYSTKLKGVDKKPLAWYIAAIVTGGVGIILLLGFVMGCIIYLLTPSIVDSMVAS